MFIKSSASGPACERLGTAFRQSARGLAVLMLAGLLPACVGTLAKPLAGPDPADPGIRTPRVGYRSTVAPYVSQRPVEPGPWREQNERVAPAPRS